ncbi:MAG: glutamate--tRNA ligase [Candidatus Sericytochromatia bacterium]|nr:glutamate--tRNA ligase [Candidatus Tanganyikabacteria bacterium]
MDAPRLRFAPSPTGYLHVGGARTALFNWLLARHQGGAFVLRIEDTDTARSTAEYTAAIFDALRWLGLDWDEGPEVGGPDGPYFQMERLAMYQEAAERLLSAGKAYRCVCQAKTDDPDHVEKCRCADAPVGADAGVPGAIRFRTPHEGRTTVDDLIHGAVSFDNAEIDDFIVLKADGVPTYNFAVVVDDAAMRITRVLRGDDHLSNTPRQVMLYEALGLPQPRFGHIPMILGPDKKRLSKRHGAVSIQAFRDDGYLPEALVNYIARLGWASGDQEIFTRDEMIAAFDLSGVGKSAAVFDYAKLEWLNGDWIRRLGVEEIARRARPYFEARGLIAPGAAEPRLPGVVAALIERSRTLVHLVDQARYFFADDLTWDEAARQELLTPNILPVLEALAGKLGALSEWTVPAIEAAFREQAGESGLKAGQVIQPVRVALTGGKVSPGMFEVAHLLGRERTLRRLGEAIDRLKAPVASS